MRIDRRLVLIGVMLVVLSMTMATQYATTKVTYSFSIVHPSNADIRFIGSDNSSNSTGTAKRCLRVEDNSSGSRFLSLDLGNWFPDSQNNYTAAFGIVNEENFKVNITHINVSGTDSSYLDIWLHGDRDDDYPGDAGTKVLAVQDGAAQFTSSSVIWTLGSGDGDTSTMSEDGTTQLTTPWDDTSGIRYSTNDDNDSINETSDFVWVGVSLDVPSDAGDQASASGTIYIHFKATTES